MTMNSRRMSTPKKLLDRLLAAMRDAHEAVLLGAFAILAGGVLTFVHLADEVAENDTRSFDEGVLAWLRPDAANPADPIGPAWLERAAMDITSLGGVAVLALISIGAAGYLLIVRRRIEASLLAVALLGGLALSETMKAVFERERPPEIHRTLEAINASFPSGHALMSTVCYLTLGAVLAEAQSKRRLKVYIMSASVLVALLVGLTRVYLGMHWASDVMAGWALGAAWAMACLLAARWLQWKFRPQQPS